MSKGSFYMNFRFNANVSGFYGCFTGDRLYCIDYYEEVEKLINDAYKILKADSPVITFEHFCDSGKDLCRLFKEYDGTLTFIRWKRAKSGAIANTATVDKIEFKKSKVKHYVLRAMEEFRAFDSEFCET